MDNFTEAEQKRLQLILQIQKLFQEGFARRDIARKFQMNVKTIKKYISGDPKILCRSNKRSHLDQHKDFIIQCLMNGMTQSETVRLVIENENNCGSSNIRQYIGSVIKEYQLKINKYISSSEIPAYQNKKKSDYITRKGIFQYLWMNEKLTVEHYNFLSEKYSILNEIEKCIREFHEIFKTKRMQLLYLFIERYKKSSIKEFASFANSLEKDFDAIENEVASDFNNAFVEGTNSKLKMVKRTMYGRCNSELLAAKLMYRPS